jgi:hypothetical protein
MKNLIARLAFRSRPDECDPTPLNCTIYARFTICGYQLPEIDLTPLLGIAFIIGIFALVARTTWG